MALNYVLPERFKLWQRLFALFSAPKANILENLGDVKGTSIYSFESVIILRFTIEKATGVFFTPTRLFFICLIYLTLACEVIESLPLRGNL